MRHDPFVASGSIRCRRTGEIAVERGRETRPDIKLGICGEHGGDPASIHFCQSVGLDYVSCLLPGAHRSTCRRASGVGRVKGQQSARSLEALFIELFSSLKNAEGDRLLFDAACRFGERQGVALGKAEAGDYEGACPEFPK